VHDNILLVISILIRYLCVCVCVCVCVLVLCVCVCPPMGTLHTQVILLGTVRKRRLEDESTVIV
jgi:hypothetical protein